MPFTTAIHIDLDAIAHNLRTIAANVPGAEIIAVVKDNAYGHGAVPVARAALGAGATRLAVGRTIEGLELRQAGIDAPILNLCYLLPAEMPEAVAHNLTTSLGSLAMARALNEAAAAQGKVAKAHVKVDTGMTRYGLLPGEVLPFLKEAAALPHLQLEGIFTHFATADEADKGYTRCQFESFEMLLEQATAAGYSFALRHAANSAASIDLPAYALNAVRPGIALYGLPPSAEVGSKGLRPALSLHSHIARVKRVPAGTGISYGLTYVTEREADIALVPVGYGDGYFRQLSNKGAVLVNGQRAPIRGRVCMDQLMVDVTGIPDVSEGTPVTLIGDGLTATELAGLAGTINYDVVVKLAARIPRVYMRGGEVVEVIRKV
jgi:alanine racemase